MKMAIIVLSSLAIFSLMGCDDDSAPMPRQHYAKHGKLLFSADQIADAVR